jgi:hypothetical protein
MQSLGTVAHELNIPPENVEREGLKALLETHIHRLSVQVATICQRYGVKTYEELDRLIQEEKVAETMALDDFQTADHLESKIRKLKKILQFYLSS